MHSFPLSLGIKVCGYLKRDLVKREGLATLARSVSDNDTFSIQTVVCQSTKELIHYGIVRKIVPTIAAEGLTSVLKVTYLYENTHQESICVQIP